MDAMVKIAYSEKREGGWESKQYTVKIPIPPITHFRRMINHLRGAWQELWKMIMEFHSPTPKEG